MEILLIVAIASLAFVSALRRSRERNSKINTYYSKGNRAPADKTARSEFRATAKWWR